MAERTPRARRAPRVPRVLVTGASGFLGGWICEAAALRGGSAGAPVAIPSIRSWASAARLARFDLRPVLADVLDAASVRAAVAGVDAVIHCAAVGKPEDMVASTENVLQAAADQGVARVVHISSAAVYGRRGGPCTEDLPLAPTGEPYADGKIAAEQACARAAARGGPEVVVLRPTLVHGPFSRTWSIQVAQRLVSGGLGDLGRLGTGRCNLVYVDDVARAALDAAVGKAPPGTYNVDGAAGITWNEYLRLFAQELGLPLRHLNPTVVQARAALLEPARKAAKTVMSKAGARVMKVYARQGAGKSVLSFGESALRNAPSKGDLRQYRTQETFPIDKAAAWGYRPRHGVERAVALTAEWLRVNGLVPGRGERAGA